MYIVNKRGQKAEKQFIFAKYEDLYIEIIICQNNLRKQADLVLKKEKSGDDKIVKKLATGHWG